MITIAAQVSAQQQYAEGQPTRRQQKTHHNY